jgi:hypothetical protein
VAAGAAVRHYLWRRCRTTLHSVRTLQRNNDFNYANDPRGGRRRSDATYGA